MAEAAEVEADPLDAAIAEAESDTPHDQLADEESTSEDETDEETELEAAAEDEEEEESEDEEESKPPAKGSPLFRKVLEKYGGDEDKLADALVHQWNSSSELHKRTQQLEQELQALKTQKPQEPAEPPEEVIDVQEDINALNEEAKSNQQSMSGLLEKMNKKNAEIYKLQGKIEDAEDFDKQRLQGLEAARQQELASIVKEYGEFERSNKRLEREYARYQRKLIKVQKQAEASRAQQARLEVESAQVRVNASRDFAEAVEMAQAKYGFPNPKRVEKLIRQEVLEYIGSLPEDSPAIDIKAYASQVFDEYAEEVGAIATKKFAAGSKAKAGSLPKGRPGSRNAPARPSKGAKSADDARAHAERILG
jgi:hypothetical protein